MPFKMKNLEGDTVQITTYDQKYDQQVVDLWNRTLHADPIVIGKFRRQALFDENFDPSLCYVALDGEAVIGFCMGMRRKFPYMERGTEPDRGWIVALFVDEAWQRQRIGTALMRRAEEDMRAAGAKNITLFAYSPGYFFPGVDGENYPASIPFFEKLGYQAGKKDYSMCKDLHGYHMSPESLAKKAAAEAKGYRFINFTYDYALELLEFNKNNFGGGWKRNALIAMQNGTAEDLILLVISPEGKICGFCMRMIDGNPSRFGPIGIDKNMRNDGLGSILLDFAQQEMAKRGIYHMYFVSTDDPGRRYYERKGVKVFRTFTSYKKYFEE